MKLRAPRNITSPGLRTTLQSLGPKSMQDLLTERACMSHTCLTDTSVRKSVVLKECSFSEANWSGIVNTSGLPKWELWGEEGLAVSSHVKI